MRTPQALKLFAVMSLCSALVACSGSDTNSSASKGTLNIVPDTIQVSQGGSKVVPFELANSQGVVNQSVRFRVSDPEVAQVSPSSCVVSSGTTESNKCAITVTGKKPGAVRLFAESDGYASDQSDTTVTTQNPYGVLSVVATDVNQSYYTGSLNSPFSITIQLTPTQGGKIIPSGSGALTVMMNNAPGITYAAQQCALSTNAPTCTITGTLSGPQASAANFSTTISVTGSWQAGPNPPYSSADNMTVNWIGSTVQSAGIVNVSSQNNSNQIFLGMRAPLFVYLTGNTLNQASYQVTVSSSDPSSLVFYQFPDGTNTLNQISSNTQTSVSCTLTLDNTSLATIASSISSCGYGLYPLKAGTTNLNVTLTQISATSTNPATPPSPTYLNLVPVTIVDPSNSGSWPSGFTPPQSRTITFTNNSTTDTVQVISNSGTANAYTSPVSVAQGGNQTNAARTVAGGQSQCGPTNPENACPIGSTCVQGGATIKAGAGTPFYCYWDAPQFASGTQGSAVLTPSTSTTLTIPGWSGVTTGGQQVQWSGNYYVQQCPGGTCPTAPSTPGTGSTYQAQSLAEVTYQHNTVDFYDVSIINGVNYALQFGPTTGQGKTPGSTDDAYTCGTAGSLNAMAGNASTNPSGYLPASLWTMTPTSSNFPTAVTDSPASYFAVVNPSTSNHTSCTQQSTCTALGTSDNVCGWNLGKVTAGTETFASNKRICGSFVSWASANQVWGWNESTTNASPFNLLATTVVSPAFQSPAMQSPQTSISVGDLQLCINNSYSANTNPQPNNQPNPSQLQSAAMSCGGTNWTGVTRPSQNYTTLNPFWVSNVLPTIQWMKNACPTCYTFPYDDMSSTFTCSKGVNATGVNTINYTIQINNLTNTFN